MKKMMAVLTVLALTLFFGSTFCQAQSPESWAIGTWRGFENQSKSSWMLEIVEKDGKLSGSFMWISETSKMYPISINFNGESLTFLTVSKEGFILNKASDHRMDGKHIYKKGRKEK